VQVRPLPTGHIFRNTFAKEVNKRLSFDIKKHRVSVLCARILEFPFQVQVRFSLFSLFLYLFVLVFTGLNTLVGGYCYTPYFLSIFSYYLSYPLRYNAYALLRYRTFSFFYDTDITR
jgi:hypothetical protein